MDTAGSSRSRASCAAPDTVARPFCTTALRAGARRCASPKTNERSCRSYTPCITSSTRCRSSKRSFARCSRLWARSATSCSLVASTSATMLASSSAFCARAAATCASSTARSSLLTTLSSSSFFSATLSPPPLTFSLPVFFSSFFPSTPSTSILSTPPPSLSAMAATAGIPSEAVSSVNAGLYGVGSRRAANGSRARRSCERGWERVTPQPCAEVASAAALHASHCSCNMSLLAWLVVAAGAGVVIADCPSKCSAIVKFPDPSLK
mmetsp:Transcript_64182/g.103731  ORF Transcript_64182/g.103731 Transcript_64182/m.103731 type:complete len:265 (-) Transcript_64182:567-1361(-)